MKNTRKPRIMLLFGGRGFEHDISVASASYIYSLIDRDSFEVLPIYILKNGEWMLTDGVKRGCKLKSSVMLTNSGAVIIDGKFFKVDAALPVLHGDFGEDGTVQGAFENAKISYIGCDTASSALCSDKAYTKSVACELGIETATYIVSKNGESTESFAERASLMGFPLFIKPARLGSSFGASKARDESELLSAIKSAYELSARVIAEECIDIKAELECAYFEAQGTRIFSGVGSILAQDGFYDYESKYLKSDAATVTDEAQIPDDISDRVRGYSEALADFIGIKHISRFDFLLSSDNRLIFNEINTFPGFTSASLYPRLMKRAGIPPEELINMLISETLG